MECPEYFRRTKRRDIGYFLSVPLANNTPFDLENKSRNLYMVLGFLGFCIRGYVLIDEKCSNIWIPL